MSTIDHTGTKPGLTPQEDEPTKHNMRCKNSVTCDSITAIELPSPGPGTRMYQCTKCKMTRVINVGGSINL